MIRPKSRFVPYLFIAPLVVLLLLIFGYPLVRIFDFSFRRVRGISGPWIGAENYSLILEQPLFRESVAHNLRLLLAVPILMVLSILIAVILYDRVRGWRVYRTILFVPYILAVPVVSVVLKNIFQFNGPFNEGLRAVNLQNLALDWIGSPDLALWTVLVVIIWRELGFGIILMLSRLLSLDEETLEAAQLDGTNWWQRLYYVILPQMTGVIEFYFVVTFITMIAAVFSYIYIITKGGPGTSSMVLELYTYNFIVKNSLPGVASAVSVMLLVVSTAMIFLLFGLRREARERELG